MEEMQSEELEAAFAANLRRRRKQLGLTLAALADRMNAQARDGESRIYVPSLSNLESGKISPTLGTIARLAAALGTSPDALLLPNFENVSV